MKIDGDYIIKCRDALRPSFDRERQRWREEAEVFTPYDDIGYQAGCTSYENMFDSHPMECAKEFANFLLAMLMPRGQKWFLLTPPGPWKDDDDAKKFFGEISQEMLDFMQDSNLYEEAWSSLFEWVVHGTCNLFCGGLDDRQELYYSHQTIGTYYIAENRYRRVDVNYRDLELTADQAEEIFGDNLPDDIKQKREGGKKTEEKFNFIHAVFKRTGELKPAKDAKDDERKPWASYYVYEKTKTIIKEEGYDFFAFAVSRYTRYATSVWGHGPGSIARGDSRQINVLNELLDVAAEKDVFPTLNAPASREGEITNEPSGINFFDDQNPNARVEPIQSGQRVDTALQRLGDKKQSVSRIFQSHLYQLFTSRIAAGEQPLTATESSLASNEGFTQLSPAWSRLVSEFLDPIISSTFATLMRNRMFTAEVPQSLYGGDGQQLVVMPSITFNNRIVIAQRAQENGDFMMFMNVMAPILSTMPNLMPEVMDNLRFSQAVRRLMRNSNIPEELISTEREAQASKANREAAQMEQAKLAAGEQASKTAANLAKVPGAGQAMQQAL